MSHVPRRAAPGPKSGGGDGKLRIGEATNTGVNLQKMPKLKNTKAKKLQAQRNSFHPGQSDSQSMYVACVARLLTGDKTQL